MFSFELFLKFGKEESSESVAEGDLFPGGTDGNAQVERASFDEPRRFDTGFRLPPE